MILITGASGNVGREVLKQAIAAGLKVRAAYQVLKRAAVPDGVEAVCVDFNQPQTLASALVGVERVFLVGPPTDQLIPLERKAVDVIARSQVRHLVKLSAMGGRDAIFPRQHAESEDYIRSAGVPFTFVRPNGFMQNLVNYSAPSIKTIGKFYGSEGDGKVSIIDVSDVAAAIVKVLSEDDHIGHAYTLTGPEAMSNSAVARRLSEILGRDIQFVNLPPGDLKTALISAGVSEWNAEALVDLQRLYREGKAAEVTDDVERILGRKPRNLTEFLIRTREAFEPEIVAAQS
jgi:uncharacterized protein YbjT (DUF2867 family)